MVERLPSMGEALGSILNTTYKLINKKKVHQQLTKGNSSRGQLGHPYGGRSLVMYFHFLFSWIQLLISFALSEPTVCKEPSQY